MIKTYLIVALCLIITACSIRKTEHTMLFCEMEHKHGYIATRAVSGYFTIERAKVLDISCKDDSIP